MGITAVPGSGKTWTLSALAAELIMGNYLTEGQEILVVTLTNSAVDNFSLRINDFLRAEGLPSLVPPYRVRTLHGLAHDIVRERPDLVGLDSNFTIIDERAANQIRNEIAVNWLQSNPGVLDNYMNPDLEEGRLAWAIREHLPRLVQSIALAFIRTAKDQMLMPAHLEGKLASLPVPLILAEMGTALYTGYQRALAYRGAVDFDDLIRLALHGLNADPEFLLRLQRRWPYILEDEAQDSSRLQERILQTLVGDNGNWVRVGDPNQAIFESFTTANPRYLRDFMEECKYPSQLPNSGRSTQSIINLANQLIDWSKEDHPNLEVRDALTEPFIQPTPPGDPQPNPPDNPKAIGLMGTKFSPEGELNAVANSLARWLPDHPGMTVAVLVPRNRRGFQLIDKLRERDIEVVDSLLRSSSTTRFTAGALGNILRFLGDPGNPRLLGITYQVWQRDAREDPESRTIVDETAKMLTTCQRVEDYLWPKAGEDWLESLELKEADPEIYESLLEFREYARRWQGTVLLPVNQIVITLAQDLFEDITELAIAHKLANLLRQAENTNPGWRLPELAGELAVIARNERRFLGFSKDDTGFDPEAYKGQVVVATMHKAKGLEWDRVYLMSVNNYDFPSGESYDRYIPEAWFIRDRLNLEAEALSQLEWMIHSYVHEFYEEGIATQNARLEYVRERLRLFYVAITRARKELIVTWNTGRKKNLVPAAAFEELRGWWETQVHD
jgi:DNA helicase-2/ATP-dependent DNA helicase PcrA